MRRYKKPHRVKRKKSIFRNRFFWLGISIFIVVGTIFYFLFLSNIFLIEKVIVTGEERVSKEDIQSFVPKKNIFLTDVQKIRDDILNNFPQIAEVEIRRQFPDRINISVVERLGLAIWCFQAHCFLLDNEGVIFEPIVSDVPGELEEVQLGSGWVKILEIEDEISPVLGQKVVEKEKLNQIFEIKSKLRESSKILIVQASVVSDERLNAKTSEGWEIYFNLKGDLNWQIAELSLVLEKQIPPEKRGNLEYIDLRFSRVYIKYRD